MRRIRWVLIAVAIVCFGVALSYPIRHEYELRQNRDGMEALSAMRNRNRVAETEPPAPTDTTSATPWGMTEPEPTEPPAAATAEPEPTPDDQPDKPAVTADAFPTGTQPPTAAPTNEPQLPVETTPTQTQPPAQTAEPAATEPPVETVTGSPAETAAVPPATSSPAEEIVVYPGNILFDVPGRTPAPTPTPRPRATTRLTPVPEITPVPTVDPSRRAHIAAMPYPYKEKVLLDEEKILPELREIWEINHDLVGWLYIEGTNIDYPVVQREDSEYYLLHDFYGNNNGNGQIILDAQCDPYTPSYNLIISGHRMDSGRMFGYLPQYYEKEKSWEEHRIVEFDSLLERKQYVVFAAFYSADYDVDEEGFRYNADIQYRVETERWLAEIRENQLYDTGIDATFGDEFITLTTCSRQFHRDGRFVVVCRRIREGEEFT